MHEIAEKVNNVILQFDCQQLVNEIDFAQKVGLITAIDPLDGLDLHRMVNQTSGERGHQEKPAIRLATEMSFVREKMSYKGSVLKREFASFVYSQDSLPCDLEQAANGMIDRIRRILASKMNAMSDQKVKFARQRMEMIDEIKDVFEDFLLSAEMNGISNNIVRTQRPTQSYAQSSSSTSTQSSKKRKNEGYFPENDPMTPGKGKLQCQEGADDQLSIDELMEILRSAQESPVDSA